MANADPEARRVIVGTYVVPTYTIEGEETAITHTEFQTSPGKALGGKGTASIDEDQWGDGWTSFSHQGAYWEDQDDHNWEVLGETWSGHLYATIGTPLQLTADGSALKFLYIKNTNENGTGNNALVALDGGTNYYIIIPPGGSVCLRGDGTQLLCNEVYVMANDSEVAVEFIIAK